MKTDRELLELAAKAAGFGDDKGRVIWTETPRASGLPNGALWNGRGHMESAELWNPLTNDGDALRLAVALRLDICRTHAEQDAVMVWVDHMGDFILEPHATDPYAATRRAIVRAAASIGEQMP